MVDRSEYYRSYYELRKEELSEKRKTLYNTNPGYRNRVKEAAREYRAKKRAEKKAERKAETARLKAAGLPIPDKKRRPKQPVEIKLGDESVMAYPIKYVAKKINKSVDTINRWSMIGLLPVTPIRVSGGCRMYTDEMINVIRKAISSRKRVAADDKAFFEEIKKGWRDSGIDM